MAREGGSEVILRKLVDVRAGETRALLWSSAYFFFVLSSFYVLRPLREEMGIARGEQELPWLYTGTLAVTIVVSPLFSMLVSRMSRRRFIPIAYRVIGAMLIGFFALFQWTKGDVHVGVARAFYPWLSAFNVFVVSVFWGYAADVFTSEQGKRLFGFISVGGTIGAIAGSYATKQLVGALGVPSLLLVAFALLEAALFAFRQLDRAHADAPPAETRAGPVAARALDGMALCARSPYLLGIAFVILGMTVSSTFVYFEQARVVRAHSDSPASRTSVFADLDMFSNLVALGLQLVATGSLLRWAGVGATLAILPALTIAGFVGLSVSPGLATLGLFQPFRRGVEYAVNKPAREVLYTVVSRDEKYKAKSFIDTFVYRGGDALAAWIPQLWKTASPTSAVRIVTTLMVALSTAWLVVCFFLGRRQRTLAEAARPAISA